MKVNDPVKIVNTLLKGKIINREIHDDDEIRYLIEFVGHDNETHQKWCLGNEIEPTKGVAK